MRFHNMSEPSIFRNYDGKPYCCVYKGLRLRLRERFNIVTILMNQLFCKIKYLVVM